MKKLVLCLLAIAACNVPSVHAQVQAPALVISLASPNELLDDFRFLARSAGAEQVVGLVQLMSQQYLQVMDATQPIGVVLDLSSGEPLGIGFLPINDYQRFTEIIGRTPETKPQPQGNGIDKITLAQPAFLKPQGKFVFVAPKIEMLQNLPVDPTVWLQGLHRDYVLAVRCNVQNIPRELRQVAVTSMRESFERQMTQQGNQPGRDVGEKLGRHSISQLEDFIENSQSLTVGWGVDQQAGTTFADLALTAMPGTKLSQKMGLLSQATTAFSGLEFANSAARLMFAGVLSPEDIRHSTDVLDTLESSALRDLRKEDRPQLAELERLVASLFKILKDTVATGRMDGGGVLLLQDTDPKLRLAVGAAVADGREVDAAFQQLVKLAKQAPNFPEVDMDSGAYKNVRFHSLTFPSKDNEGRRVFGDTIKMAVGMGQQHVYFAIGGDPVDTLKQVIDKRARPAAANPMELTLALTPIIRFAKAVDDAPAADAILEALAKAAGRDHFTISSQVIQNGMRYRINIEDGIIRAVATASGL